MIKLILSFDTKKNFYLKKGVPCDCAKYPRGDANERETIVQMQFVIRPIASG